MLKIYIYVYVLKKKSHKELWKVETIIVLTVGCYYSLEWLRSTM